MGEHSATGALQRGAVMHTAICGLRELLLLQRDSMRAAECPPSPDIARSPMVSGVICKEPRVPSQGRSHCAWLAWVCWAWAWFAPTGRENALGEKLLFESQTTPVLPRVLVLRHVSCCCKAQLSEGNAPAISDSCCFGFAWKQRVGECNLLLQGSKKL